MPIYEYQCERCHHHLEALQKISDKPLRECPECGRHTLKRLLSAPLFRLAGSGWYETDFKSDKETRRNLAGRDEAPAGDGGAARESTSQDSGADKKPAAPSAGDGKEPGARKTIVPKPTAKASSAARSKPSKAGKAKAGKAARRR
jgi:putative FmdB family regulatory protein